MIISRLIVVATLLILLPDLVQSVAPGQPRRRHLVPAVYIFGDSLVDVGNNNYLPGDLNVRANYPHYGVDYPGGKPTGRFSNGFLAVDFLAQKLGFQESPPAVLSVRSPTNKICGVSFASGGSGVLDTTRPNVTLSMNAQLAHFKQAVRLLSSAEGVKVARRRLGRSLFVVSTGNNDLFLYAGQGQQNPSQDGRFVSSIATQLGSQLRTLSDLGARKFAVLGSPPLGCAPFTRELDPKGGCSDNLNSLATDYNAAVKRELRSIAGSPGYRRMRYSFVDTYAMITTILKEPRKFGFKEVVKACCGSGRFNGLTPCFPNTTYCANRDEYALWDWSHPTQAAYKIIADWAYDGPRTFVQPVNIQALIQ